MIQYTNFDVENTLKTSNNSYQDFIAYTVNQQSSGFFTYKIVAQRLSDLATISWTVNGSFKRGTGTAPLVFTELVGSIVGASGDKLALLVVTANFTTDPNNIILQVKGLNSADIIWFGKITGYTVYDDGM